MSRNCIVRTGLGQASHRFLSFDSSKPCVIGGIIFEDEPGFQDDSDGDVVMHALCRAIGSLVCKQILIDVNERLLLKEGITNSEVYVQEALKELKKQQITHVAFSIEAKKPEFSDITIQQIRENIARILSLQQDQVGLSVVSGDGLTDFGCGDGIQALCIITTQEYT